MALPFSLTAPTEYGHNEAIASFASLEEAEAALSSLLSELEEASPSRAFSLSCLISQLQELLLEASETEEEPLS
jgi:O-succinylbenzoate synthase